jgi:hypothetical protein
MFTKNQVGRKTAPAPAAGSLKTGKGHFAAAAQRIAKKRSGVLQTGVPKHAPTGTNGTVGNSRIVARGKGLTAQSTEGQTALNPKQQGPGTKNAQTDGRNGGSDG